MKTIYSDGKRYEIERKLKITVFLPQICHFCKEEITIFGKESESLCFHSLDDNHDNWAPSNKRPAHYGCHSSFHHKGKPHPWMGDKSPSKRPGVRDRISKAKTGKPQPWNRGDKNVMRRPEQRQRMRDNNPMKDPKIKAKHLESMRSPEHRANLFETWDRRREKWGPSGRKPKEEK